MIVYPPHVQSLDRSLRKDEPIVVLPPLHPDYLRRLVLEWMGTSDSPVSVRLFEPGLGSSGLEPRPGTDSGGVLGGCRPAPTTPEFLRSLIELAVPRPAPADPVEQGSALRRIYWLTGSASFLGDPVAASLLTALCRRVVAYRLPWRLLLDHPDGPAPRHISAWRRDLELQAPRNEANLEENFADRVLRLLSPELCAVLEKSGEGQQKTEFDEIVRKVQGLDAAAINLVLSAAVRQTSGGATDDDTIKRFKQVIEHERGRQLKRASGLEVVLFPSEREELKGMNRFQRYLDYVSVLFDDAGRPGADASSPRPKGVLLAGLPGCGKSLAARLTAERLNVPLLRMDVGGMLGRYLGESEANLRRALDAAEAAAPCVLWVDEIEKALGGQSEEGGGTSKRMLGQLLTWMQEHKSQVYIFATANSVKKLPPELLRRGRFDELWRVMLPDDSERESILRSKLEALKSDLDGTFAKDVKAIRKIVKETEKFTGADLTSLVQEAWMSARVFEEKVKKRHLLDVLERGFVPMSDQFKDEISQSMSDLDKHGFRDVTCEDAELPAKVPAERQNARGRLVPELAELWKEMPAGRVVIKKGEQVETLRLESRNGDHRPIWLGAGDLKKRPRSKARDGVMERKGSRLLLKLNVGRSKDPELAYLEWDSVEGKALFREEPVELLVHPDELPAPESKPDAAAGRLGALTVDELRVLAKDRGVSGAGRMGKGRLIEALTLAKRKGAQAERKSPAKQPRTVRPGAILTFNIYGKTHRLELPRQPTGASATLRWGSGQSTRYRANRGEDGSWVLFRTVAAVGGVQLAKQLTVDVSDTGDVRVLVDRQPAMAVDLGDGR